MHQLQLPLDSARRFFGPNERRITLNVFVPITASTATYSRDVTVSRVYARSGTRRINRFHDLGAIPSAFMFFQETSTPDVYDFWWQDDKAVIAARFHPWNQARNSQHGRGRLATIATGLTRAIFDRID